MLDASTRRLAVELLVKLVETYSPTFKEEGAVGVLEDYTVRMGFNKVRVDEAGSLIAEVGGSGRTLLMAGHIDTVDEPLEVVLEDGRLKGRGAVDAKGPLAAMTMAAYLASQHLDLSNLKVVLAALVGEEGPSHGAKRIVESVKADYIVVGEPTGLDGVIVGCRGSCRLTVECTGSGGHTANPQLYRLPCMELVDIIKSIGGELKGYTVTLVYMECGSRGKLNVIPKRATAIFNVRIPVGGSSDSLRPVIEESLKTYNCMWSLSECTEPFKTSPNNPVARAAVRALLKLGFKPRIAYKAGTSDMTILSRITGNIVEIGPGRPELSHTDFEEISLEDYLAGIKVYYNMIELLARERGGGEVKRL